MENPLWRWKNPGKIQGNTSQYYYYCCTDDLTVMDSSQRVWTSNFLYSLPSVLSTSGWTVPYLASNVGGGDCGAVVI